MIKRKMESLTVLIPAHNEERLIGNTLPHILNYLKSLKVDFEIIVCINSSTDKTEQIVSSFSKKDKRVKYLLIKEKGFGIAVRKGIKSAKKNVIVYMPADNEVDKSFIGMALKQIKDYDVVSGSRYLDKDYLLEDLFRDFLSRAYAKITRAFISNKITECGTVKMYKSKWAKEFVEYCTRDGWDFQLEELYLALKHKKKIVEIPIKVNEQNERQSKVHVVSTTLSLLKSVMKYWIKLRV
ncbi:glycosyltransferase family 2 protein [Candidatus Woesearchaeota archaeon]|nr:glycosyltransferase family 2 protein [Candidatus Woesearchaeota archaeon]